ncbi:hypothetical protein ACJX0J_037077, partial [Zea mays]
ALAVVPPTVTMQYEEELIPSSAESQASVLPFSSCAHKEIRNCVRLNFCTHLCSSVLSNKTLINGGISFMLFDDIQDFNNLPHVKSIFARVVVKFPRRHDSQHFILQDITGSKMEAISSRNNVPRFDALLTQGCTYTLYRVGFCLNREGIQFRNIGHGLEIGLITHTIVEPFIKPIQFPPFPKYLMPFHKVYQQPHKSFVDIIGIVLHLEPLKHIGGRPYREAVLMDSRWDLIVVGVWTDLLQRNALRWMLGNLGLQHRSFQPRSSHYIPLE